MIRIAFMTWTWVVIQLLATTDNVIVGNENSGVRMYDTVVSGKMNKLTDSDDASAFGTQNLMSNVNDSVLMGDNIDVVDTEHVVALGSSLNVTAVDDVVVVGNNNSQIHPEAAFVVANEGSNLFTVLKNGSLLTITDVIIDLEHVVTRLQSMENLVYQLLNSQSNVCNSIDVTTRCKALSAIYNSIGCCDVYGNI